MIQQLRTLATSAVLLATLTNAQWNQYAHPGYQSIFSITTSPGAIHMVAYASGVITSTNGGTVWNPTNTGLPTGTDVQSVGYNGSALFSGTHSGVYKSTNQGGSWTLSNTGMPSASASNYANKFFRYSTTTFAIFNAPISGGGGIYRTTDNGVNWFSGNGGLSSNMTVYQIAEIGGVLWAATNTGLAYSTNLGVSWTPDPNSNFSCYAVQGTPTRMVIVSAFGYRYRNFSGGTWQSTWTNATGGPANPSGGELILYDSKFWSISNTNNTIYRSTNNGQTWTTYAGGIVSPDTFSQYEFHAAGNILFLGTLTHLYGHPGTTTGEPELADAGLPLPYPTLFTEGFNVDLSDLPAGQQLLLVDALGREALRTSEQPKALVRVERGSLPQGTYRLIALDPVLGARHVLGALVAQ